MKTIHGKHFGLKNITDGYQDSVHTVTAMCGGRTVIFSTVKRVQCIVFTLLRFIQNFFYINCDLSPCFWCCFKTWYFLNLFKWLWAWIPSTVSLANLQKSFKYHVIIEINDTHHLKVNYINFLWSKNFNVMQNPTFL